MANEDERESGLPQLRLGTGARCAACGQRAGHDDLTFRELLHADGSVKFTPSRACRPQLPARKNASWLDAAFAGEQF